MNSNGTVDTAFDPGAGGLSWSWVNALAVQTDGKTLVGGHFLTLGGGGAGTNSCPYLGRLDPDGSLDTSFNPSADNDVYSLVVQTNGQILVGGAFQNLAFQPRHSIGRLNANGALDTSFDPGAGMVLTDRVYSVTLQPDGRILVGGAFTQLAGQARTNIGRLNSDGALHTGFTARTDGAVSCLAVQADGKILVGGSFRMLNGQPRNCLGRLLTGSVVDNHVQPRPQRQQRFAPGLMPGTAGRRQDSGRRRLHQSGRRTLQQPRPAQR